MSEFRDEIKALIHAHQREMFFKRVLLEHEQHLLNPRKTSVKRVSEWELRNGHSFLAGCKIAIPTNEIETPDE